MLRKQIEGIMNHVVPGGSITPLSEGSCIYNLSPIAEGT